MTCLQASDDLVSVAADGIDATVVLSLGMIADVAVSWRGRVISPFAKAPWRGLDAEDERFPLGMPPHLAQLSGDFFCAPFCDDDVEGSPPHGKTANGRWRVVEHSRARPISRLVMTAEDRIAGASIFKIITLVDGHPFVYQQHVLCGADLEIPVAHHTMVDASGGLELEFSPTSFAETPARPVESDPAMGRSVLAYPARSRDITRFPLAHGGTVSLVSYPISHRHEDTVMLVADPRADESLGWAIAHRPAHDDSVLLAADSRVLPETMLWFSNGGRSYAPWLGEHTNVLGIEMGCFYSSSGWSASVARNSLSDAGFPTAVRVTEGHCTVISYAMGAVGGRVALRDGRFVTATGERVPFSRELTLGADPLWTPSDHFSLKGVGE
jgi:hypothetical protein